MRVWDVDPGYLNRQSLLGEHAEIHAVFSILANNKAGYARHPETLRWRNKSEALAHRHARVVSEMQLRGYGHHSPVESAGWPVWPDRYVDTPARQFAILRAKYVDREQGRIPLPSTVENLWEQHRFSILARDPLYCSQKEQMLALCQDGTCFHKLATALVCMLRRRPPSGPLGMALDLMWDRVAVWAKLGYRGELDRPEAMIVGIRELAVEHQVLPLLESTALSELAAWS